jgi:hypothetical protein
MRELDGKRGDVTMTISLCSDGCAERVQATAGRECAPRQRRATGRDEWSVFTLRDERGEALGRIVAPETRPVTGPHAPTLYLQRGT